MSDAPRQQRFVQYCAMLHSKEPAGTGAKFDRQGTSHLPDQTCTHTHSHTSRLEFRMNGVVANGEEDAGYPITSTTVNHHCVPPTNTQIGLGFENGPSLNIYRSGKCNAFWWPLREGFLYNGRSHIIVISYDDFPWRHHSSNYENGCLLVYIDIAHEYVGAAAPLTP